MARLPVSGSDSGTWGDVLNEYLLVAHNADGTAKPVAVAPELLSDTVSFSLYHHQTNELDVPGPIEMDIPFYGVEYDYTNGAIATANGTTTFTPPQNGLYHLEFIVQITQSNTVLYNFITININGEKSANPGIYQDLNIPVNSVSHEVYLTVNDEVTVAVNNLLEDSNNPTDPALVTHFIGNKTKFSGRLITPGTV